MDKPSILGFISTTIRVLPYELTVLFHFESKMISHETWYQCPFRYYTCPYLRVGAASDIVFEPNSEQSVLE